MLEQAIIDAKQLKETAQQSAEEAVIEKYQSEIREAVEKILEQEEEVAEEVAEEVEMTVDDQGDLAVLEDLPAAQTTPVDEIVTIDLDKLEEMMAEEMEEGDMDPSVMEGHEEVALEIDALTEDLEELDEEVELDEAELQNMLEEDDLLEVDIPEDELAALVTAVARQLKEEVLEEGDAYLNPDTSAEDKGIAAEETAEDLGALEEKEEKDFPDLTGDGEITQADILKGRGVDLEESKLKKENKSLLKEQTVLSKKLQLLESKIEKYDTVITKLKNKLEEGNLANARLLYQNRVLDSISLNERQKDKIVEAIGNAKTVEEAKIIYETLQSAVGSAKRTKKPESLNEVVTRNSSAFMPRKRETKKEDSFAKRMKILAGLNK